MATTPNILDRTVLHFQDEKSDKLYVIERLDQGPHGVQTYVSWGRRRPDGRGLASKAVTAGEALRLKGEKSAKGYKTASPLVVVGLSAAPLTASSVWMALEAGSAVPDPGPTATPSAFVDNSPSLAGLAADGRKLTGMKKLGAVGKGAAGDPFAYVVDSAGDPAMSYAVDMRHITCSCPSFKKGICKHIKHIAAQCESDLAAAWKVTLAAEAGRTAAAPLPDSADAGNLAALARSLGIPPDKELGAVHRIFAPFIRETGGDEALIPALEDLVWDEAHARRLALGFRRRTPVMLFGPTGAGKTAMPKAFAAMTNRPLQRVNMSVQGTVADFIGKYEVRDGATVWADGILPVAMKRGHILLIDESDHMDASVGSSLFPVMEEGGSLTLKEHLGEVIEPHPDFAIFLTGNALGLHDDQGVYHGAQAMNAALLARCGVAIRVEYPSKAVELSILMARGVLPVMAQRVADASALVRSMIEAGTVVGAWGIRQSVNFAVNATELDSFEQGFQASACAAFTRDEFNALWEAVKRSTGTAAPSRLMKAAA